MKRNPLVAMLCLLAIAPPLAPLALFGRKSKDEDADAGIIDLDLGRLVGGVVAVVLAVVVVVIVLANLAPTFFTNLGELVDVFESTAAENSTGNTVADNIKTGVFPIIIALGGLFVIAGIALAVFAVRRR